MWILKNRNHREKMILEDLRVLQNTFEYELAYGIVNHYNYKKNMELKIKAIKDIIRKYE